MFTRLVRGNTTAKKYLCGKTLYLKLNDLEKRRWRTNYLSLIVVMYKLDWIIYVTNFVANISLLEGKSLNKICIRTRGVGEGKEGKSLVTQMLFFAFTINVHLYHARIPSIDKLVVGLFQKEKYQIPVPSIGEEWWLRNVIFLWGFCSIILVIWCKIR